MSKGRTDKKTILLIAVLAIITVLVSIRRIFINIHIDEEDLIATAYRVISGDQFFTQIQEPQLLITPFLALLEKIFLSFNGGVEGIAVYLKVVAALITIAIGSYMFYALSHILSANESALITAAFLFFHFRYVNITDYTFLYCAGAVMCATLLLNCKSVHCKSVTMIIAGVSFCAMVISLPIAIIAFPLYCFWIYRESGNKKDVCVLIITCIICGLAECFVLFRGNSLQRIPSLIGELVSSSSYAKKDIPYLLRAIEFIGALLLMPLTNLQQKVESKVMEIINDRFIMRGGIAYQCYCFSMDCLNL